MSKALRGSGTARHVLRTRPRFGGHGHRPNSGQGGRVPPILPYQCMLSSGTLILLDGFPRLHLHPPARLVWLVTSSDMRPEVRNFVARATQLSTSRIQIEVNTMSGIADVHFSTFKMYGQPEARPGFFFLSHLKQNSLPPQLNSPPLSPLTCNCSHDDAFRKKRFSAPRACMPLGYGICKSFWCN